MFRFLLVAAAGLIALPAAAAERLYTGGPIYTARDDRPTVEAVLVENGRIAFAGALEAARRRAGEDAETIDLAGNALYPGFTDAHAHFSGIGQREMTLNLEDVGSIDELKTRVEEAVAEAGPGETVYGRGWIETHWPNERFPTREDLDPVTPDTPVFLVRADGHAAVVNSAGLEAAGIAAETEAPAGGKIRRGPEGRPTGMLIDNAMDLASELQLDRESIDWDAAYEKADAVYTERGWTGIHNMSVPWADALLLEKKSEAGEVALRLYNSIVRSDVENLFEAGRQRSDNGRVVTRAIKLYLDGALGSRGALLFEPYSDAEGNGLQRIEKETAMPILTRALEAGLQVDIHAIGDKANHLALDWYEEAFSKVPPGERALEEPRWRIEHAQTLRPDDIPRFAELGVIASMQPSHAIGDLHFAPDRLGLETGRLAGAYAWQSLLDSGAVIAAGSDAPVEKGDPLIEFYAAVARKDLDDFSGEGWHPEEAVSRAAALKMLTAWPAYGAFAEEKRGTIEAGKQADFTVFSADIMQIPESQIPKVRAVMTVIGGDIVHRLEAAF